MLEGTTALVTGAAHGIGKATVETLARQGAQVHALDIATEALDLLATEMASAELDVITHTADVREDEAVAAVVEALAAAGRSFDIVVNNVGHYLHGAAAFVDTDDEAWHEVFELNFWPVLRVCRAVLPSMIAAGTGGSIVNLTTVEAFRGKPEHAVYAAAKAAVSHFSKSLALEVGEYGIRVNNVAPDVTRSQQLPYDRWLDDDDLARVPSWVPVGRLGEPDDIADVILFLCSDLSRFVTGTTVHADGGTAAAGGWYRTARGRGGWTNRPHEP